MRRLAAFALTVALVPAAAQAIKIIRTGGDALRCNIIREEIRGGATHVYTSGHRHVSLDIEANRDLRGIEPAVADLRGDEVARAEALVARLVTHDPPLAATLAAWARAWPAQVVPEEREFTEDIPDSEHLNLPWNCSPVQLIIQELHEDGSVRYRLSLPVWRQLDVDHRAFMIVHELLYRYAHPKGHTNSFYIAYLNALIAADRLAEMTPAEYASLKSMLHLEE